MMWARCRHDYCDDVIICCDDVTVLFLSLIGSHVLWGFTVVIDRAGFTLEASRALHGCHDKAVTMDRDVVPMVTWLQS